MMSVRGCVLLFVSALTMAQSNPVPFIKQPLAARMPNGVSQPNTATHGKMVESYGKLPLSFEANLGQADGGVKFLSRGKAIASASGIASPSGLNFAPAVSYGSGGQSPLSVVVADLDGDGKLDLAVASCGGNPGNCGSDVGTVGVLMGKGDGTFNTAVAYGSGGLGAYSVTIADVNGDGKPDLVVANFCANSNCATGSVGVLLGNGDGTFQTAVTYNSGGARALSVAVADVNGDAKPDIVVANDCTDESCSSSNGAVGVLLGNGDGTFQTVVTYGSGGYEAYSVAVADMNEDGKPDIVVSNNCADSTCSGSSSVGVLLGNGDGTFQTAVNHGTGGTCAYSLAVADLNGDGKPDLLVGNACSSTVGVLLGNGDGTFRTAVTYPSGGLYAESVAAGDVNGDGKPDLIVANFCASGGDCGNEISRGSVGVLLGNGDGTFQTAVTYDSGGVNGRSVAVADVNDDSKPDLLVVNWCASTRNCNNGIVGVLINASLTPTSTVLGSSRNPSNFGQPVTFTTTVTSQGFKGTPMGTVSFRDGTTNLGNSALNASGVATLTVSTLGVGTHRITASYDGSTDFAPSTSPVLSQLVQGAIAQLSASSVAFGNETVGMTSAAKSITLTNKGNIALTIASVGIVGANSADFVASKCPTSIAPSGTCTISVTFKPSATGARTAALSITDNAPHSPQKVSLTGVGVLPTVTLSPTSLTFPTQIVFTTGAAKVVTLKNTGLGVATLKSITVTGPFGLTKSCGTNVNPGGGCTLSVTFEPKTMGASTGSLTVTDNATNSPQKVTLAGTGTYVKLAPTSINFGNQPEGSKSLAKQITLTNEGAAAVSITSIAITGADLGDFAQTHTCGTSVASGASCFINVTFKPSATGTRTAQVAISDNGGGSPQKVTLVGTGTP